MGLPRGWLKHNQSKSAGLRPARISSPVNWTFGSVNVPVGVPGPITHDVLPSASVPSCWTLSGCSSVPGIYRVVSAETSGERDCGEGHSQKVYGERKI